MQNTLSTPKVKDATVMNQNSGTGSMYYEDSWVKEDVLYPDLFTFITDGNLNWIFNLFPYICDKNRIRDRVHL